MSIRPRGNVDLIVVNIKKKIVNHNVNNICIDNRLWPCVVVLKWLVYTILLSFKINDNILINS